MKEQKSSSFEFLYGRQNTQPLKLTLNKEGRKRYESEEDYWIQKFIQHHKWIQETIENIETTKI